LHAGTPVVEAAGEIDISNVESFRSAVADAARAHGGPLIVSLRGVTYLDSHTLATLVAVKKNFATNRRPLLVVAPKSGPVARVMSITNLNALIPMFETVEEAAASIA
jgi:anti-anti-sigma factor